MERINGEVKWFQSAKGFGFIVANGVDHFVHYSDIVGDGFRDLAEGQRVTFVPKTRDKGLYAADVEVTP